MTKLLKFWENRKSFTPNTQNWKPYRGWAKQERKHLVFLVKIANKEIISKLEGIQENLSSFNSYIRFPKNYYHITIKPWEFLNNSKKYSNDLSTQEVNEVIEKIDNNFKNIKKFRVELKGINVFPDVIFVECHDEGNLAQLNKKLIKINKIKTSWRDYPNFIPHCAIGTFKNDKIENLIKKLENFREFFIGNVEIDSFELVIAHWHNTKFPKFETIKKFKLK